MTQGLEKYFLNTLGKIVDAFDYIKINNFSLVYTTVDRFNSWQTGKHFFQCAKQKGTNIQNKQRSPQNQRQMLEKQKIKIDTKTYFTKEKQLPCV